MSSNRSRNTDCSRQMETENSGAVTVKVEGKKPRGPKRGSHCMLPQGGKIPTSEELMAMKQQQMAPAFSKAASEQCTGAISANPPRQKGKDKMPTSADLTAHKQQASAGQISQDTASSASAMKMKGNKPRRGSQMMPDAQGQMQNLSVKYVSPNGQPASTFEAANEHRYGESSPSHSNSNRGAQRRGSVVRTLMQEQNEDNFNESVMMKDAYSGQVLPQRRSSQNPDNGHRPSMPKIDHSEAINSDDFGGAKKGPYKKKDIGRKAIRDTTSDIKYVHRVIPKPEEAKALIHGAIKPNILFRACSAEELIDLVDAFEPQYVHKGSVVIKEGNEGDHFYVVERGGVDVIERGVYKTSLYSGVAFGEIALLYSCPRTATVVAKYDCKLWVINRRAFRGITAEHKKKRLEVKLEFLKKVCDIVPAVA